jgi:hypothetical protein
VPNCGVTADYVDGAFTQKCSNISRTCYCDSHHHTQGCR